MQPSYPIASDGLALYVAHLLSSVHSTHHWTGSMTSFERDEDHDYLRLVLSYVCLIGFFLLLTHKFKPLTPVRPVARIRFYQIAST